MKKAFGLTEHLARHIGSRRLSQSFHPGSQVHRVTDGGVNIEFDVDDQEYLWFAPTASVEASSLRLAANRRYEFTMQTEVSRGATLRLRLDLFAEPDRKTRIWRKRILLYAGRSRFSIRTGSEPVYMWPAFKLRGDGEVGVREFVLGAASE